MIELDKVETKAAQYSRRNNVELTYDISNYIPEKLFKDTIITSVECLYYKQKVKTSPPIFQKM